MNYEANKFDTVKDRRVFLKAYMRDSRALTKDQTLTLIKNGFCSAPASTKYHGSYEGGLFDHSMNVAEALVQLTEENGLQWERPISPVIIGVLHDLCKIDQYLYDEASGTYRFNNDLPIKGHGDKSVVYCHEMLGLDLTEEEEACILYHMGAFTEATEWNNYTSAIHKFPNVLWTHHADMIATHIMEVENG